MVPAVDDISGLEMLDHKGWVLDHGLKSGDLMVFTERRTWYVRLWRWITRYKEPTYVIKNVTRDSFEISVVTQDR